MKYDYERDFIVGYSDIGNHGDLGIIQSFEWQQDMLTEFFESFGSDNYTLHDRDGALWVFTKTKMRIVEMPVWKQVVHARSTVTKRTKITFESETVFSDRQGKTLFIFKSEACAIDVAERKIRRIDTVHFPSDMESDPPAFTAPFERRRIDTEGKRPVLTYTVQPVDIDYSEHFNNVNYVRLALSSLGMDFLKRTKIEEVEIHFTKETLLGSVLSVFREDGEGKTVSFSVRCDGSDAAVITFKYA